MRKPRTFLKRIFLDNVFNRSSEGSNHWVGSTIKAFRVINTNNDNFKLTIVADPFNGSIEGIPLSEVRLHNYSTIANDAVLENSEIQAGVWVDILFSIEDELVWTGNKETGGSYVAITEGNNHFSQKIVMPSNTIQEIIPASDERIVTTIQAKNAVRLYIGNPSELGLADYQEVCMAIDLDVNDTFVWKNSASLSAIALSPCTLSVFSEVS